MPTPVFGIPCEGPRLVPFGTIRLPSDKLKNGHPAFRVTQSFWHLDSYWNDGRIHGALDCGNFMCGDDILASADGTVQWAEKVSDGALGVSIEHGDGWVSQYYHLATLKVTSGQVVKRGQVIGTNGDTGFAQGRGCHVHFVILRHSVKLDPWQYLIQPDQALPDTATPEEEDDLPKRLHFFNPRPKRTIKQGRAIRDGAPSTSAPRLLGANDTKPYGPYEFDAICVDGTAYDNGKGGESRRWAAYQITSDPTDRFRVAWVPTIYLDEPL